MKMRLLCILGLCLLTSGCVATMQTASISEAYKKYEKQEYEKTLVLITRAENVREMHADQKAEMTYLKAQAYEGLGKSEVALTLYRYLREQHACSQYGYLASERLVESSPNECLPINAIEVACGHT